MIACRQQYPVLVAKHVSIHGSFYQEPWNEWTTIIHVPSLRSQSSHPISFIPCSVQLLHEGELFLDFNSTSTSWLMALPSPRMVGVLGNMVSHGVPKHKSLVSIKVSKLLAKILCFPRRNTILPILLPNFFDTYIFYYSQPWHGGRARSLHGGGARQPWEQPSARLLFKIFRAIS